MIRMADHHVQFLSQLFDLICQSYERGEPISQFEAHHIHQLPMGNARAFTLDIPLLSKDTTLVPDEPERCTPPSTILSKRRQPTAPRYCIFCRYSRRSSRDNVNKGNWYA
jgi:hypothetical protein